MSMNPCTCHISNLRCKNKDCEYLVNARGILKTEIAESLKALFSQLEARGFSREKCVRALRREILHKNSCQLDVFDEIADKFWGKKCP